MDIDRAERGWTLGTQGKTISQCLSAAGQAHWQFARQAGISVGSLDGVQVCPVPSMAQGLVLLALPSWQEQGRVKELALPSSQVWEAWLVPSQLSSTAGVCMGVCDTPDTLSDHTCAGLVQSSPLSLTEEGVTRGAP